MSAFTLPSICDRAAARTLHVDLHGANEDAPIVFDASKVERIGQAMLQVLVSAEQSVSGITVKDASEAFLEATRLAGLAPVLTPEVTQ